MLLKLFASFNVAKSEAALKLEAWSDGTKDIPVYFLKAGCVEVTRWKPREFMPSVGEFRKVVAAGIFRFRFNREHDARPSRPSYSPVAQYEKPESQLDVGHQIAWANEWTHEQLLQIGRSRLDGLLPPRSTNQPIQIEPVRSVAPALDPRDDPFGPEYRGEIL